MRSFKERSLRLVTFASLDALLQLESGHRPKALLESKCIGVSVKLLLDLLTIKRATYSIAQHPDNYIYQDISLLIRLSLVLLPLLGIYITTILLCIQSTVTYQYVDNLLTSCQPDAEEGGMTESNPTPAQKISDDASIAGETVHQLPYQTQQLIWMVLLHTTMMYQT